MKRSEWPQKLLGLWFFYRWHPEVALRYLPVVDEIQSLPPDANILDVGSSGLGIAPYLKREVTGVDPEFKPPFHPLLTRVQGSALALPFPDQSFEIVISVDMLEHLKKDERKKAITEMMRVARKLLIIAFPCGLESQKQDELLDQLYEKRYKKRYVFLEEQVSHGLPEESDIRDTIVQVAKSRREKMTIRVVGNENLSLRYFLMKGWMTKNIFVNIFFRKILLFAVPLLRTYNNEPTYRKIFILNII